MQLECSTLFMGNWRMTARNLRRLFNMLESFGTLWFVASCMFLSRVSGQQVPKQEGPKVTIANPETLMSPQLLSRAIWDTNAYYQIYKQRSYENLVLLFITTEAYKKNPTLDPDNEIAFLNKVHEEYKDRYSTANGNYHLPEDEVQAAESMLTLAGAYGGPYAIASKPLADEILKLGIKGYESYAKGQQQVAAQQYLSDTASYSELLGRYIDEAWILANDNDKAKRVMTTYFGSVFNANPDDSAADIKSKNPEFRVSSEVDELVAASENNKLTIDQLRLAVTANDRQMNETLTKLREELVRLDKLETAYLAAPTEHDRQAIQAQEQVRFTTNIEGAKSGVYLLSTFASLLNDKGLSHTISVTGNATIQVISAVQQYETVMSNPAITSLNRVASSVTLAAGWLSADLAIVSLLQPGVSSDQLISEQLNAIRKQLVQLREEMHERFDRVDLRLNQLFLQMSDQFDALVKLLNGDQVSLAEINAATVRLDEGLLELNLGLSRLEANLQEYFKIVYNQEIDRRLESCFKSNRVTQQSFIICLSDLRYEALEANVKLDPLRNTAVDDETIFKTSTVRPLSPSYVYLARVGASAPFGSHEMTTLENQLVNPVEWSFGVDAYLGLLLKYPRFGTSASHQDLVDMRAAGDTLRKMALASRQLTLYEALLKNYSVKRDALKVDLQAAEDQYAQDHVPGANPFRVGPKAFNYRVPAAVQSGFLLPCSQPSADFVLSSKTLSLPSNIQTLIPKNYLMAETLGVGKIELCYEVPQYFEEFSGKRPAQNTFQFYEAPSIRIHGSFVTSNIPSFPSLIVFDRLITSTTKFIFWGWKVQSDAQPGRYLTDEGKHAADNAVQIWDGELRERFVNESTTTFHGSTEDAAGDKLDQTLVDGLNNKTFNDYTIQFHRMILDKFKGGTESIAVASRNLTVAKILVEVFASIGFPDELEKDEKFRSLLFGTDALPSGQDIANSFAQVFDTPAKNRRDKASAALKDLKIEENKENFIAAIKAGNLKAARQFIWLDYWLQLNQGERESAIRDACDKNSPHPDFVVCGLIRGTNDKHFDWDRNDQLALTVVPYDLIGKLGDDRTKMLSEDFTLYSSSPSKPYFPMIDNTLDRLTMFMQFHPGNKPKATP
jgi:hypothetical protein